MRARLPVLISLCVSVLAFSAACSDSANPIMGPDGPVVLKAITSVVVTPSQATLSAGKHIAIKATAADSSGMPVTGSITWSSSDTTVAKVSDSGDVVAVAPGQAMITASVGRAHAAATVQVSASRVAEPGEPAPTGPTTSEPTSDSATSRLWTDQPSGLATFTNQPWSSIPSLGWKSFTYGHDYLHVVTDPTSPTGDHVLQFDYPQGYSGGGYGPAVVTYNVSASDLYIGFYWKLSPNWQGHSTGVNKMFYIFQRKGEDRQALFFIAHGQNAPYHFEISNEPDGGNWFTQNQSNVAIQPGQWYKVELHLRRSSSDGAPDGLVEWWVDGQLAARYTNAKLRDEPFSEVHIDPVWGGNDPSIKKLHDDYERFGYFHVSGR